MFWHDIHLLFHVPFLTLTWSKHIYRSVISGVRHELYENCALLGHYAVSNGSLLATFRNSLSVHLQGPILEDA